MARRAPPPTSFPWGPVLIGTGAVGIATALLWPRRAQASLLPEAQPPLRPEPTPSTPPGAPPTPTPATPPSATHPTQVTAPRSSLRPIDRATTQRVQTALQTAGYGAYLGARGVDGLWGGATDAALTAWAAADGMGFTAALNLAIGSPTTLVQAITRTTPTVVGPLPPLQIRMAIQGRLNVLAQTTHLLDELRSPQNQAALGGRTLTTIDGVKNPWTVMALNALGIRGWEAQWDGDPTTLFTTVNAIA